MRREQRHSSRTGDLKRAVLAFVLGAMALVATSPAAAQSDAEQVRKLLEPRLIPSEVVSYQVMQYLMEQVPPFDVPSSREAWEVEARSIRARLLDRILTGWPLDHLPTGAFVETDVVEEPGQGYRIRKLRYEIVPGFYGAALLYEPDPLPEHAPAILNVNGHGWNKAIEWKQKRCIQQARTGIFALSLEWMFYGELEHPENKHWFGPHLDLVGANGAGLFYLAMKRGLDFLYDHPRVDRARIGMTGLSGGGWQTLLLTALDERVAAAVPVAGFSGLESRIERGGGGDIGDYEQKGTDLLAEFEYPHLVGLVAPRWFLTIHNAKDIFRSHLVKRRIYDDVRPVWGLFGVPERFAFHENFDPGDHNYALENRVAAYRFFDRAFGRQPAAGELDVGRGLRTDEELTVGLPRENLTILGLARRLAGRIDREPLPPQGPERDAWAVAARKVLQEVVRAPDVRVDRAWTLFGTREAGVETRSYRFDLSNRLGAAGVWVHSIWGRREPGAVTIVLHDDGRAAAARRVSDLANRGEPVLALDLLFTGDVTPAGSGSERTVQAFAGLGDRPLGLRAAQLLAIAEWLRSEWAAAEVRVEAIGMRSQVAALVAAALEPAAFSGLTVDDGIATLGHLLEAPVLHSEAPELFCFDLYRRFDLDRLQAIAGIPVRTRLRQGGSAGGDSLAAGSRAASPAARGAAR